MIDMKWQKFIDEGINTVNDMGEKRETYEHSIVFPNGYVGSIVEYPKGEFSVAVCDWNGYFNWNILKPFGTDQGTIICKTEEDVCNALLIIKSINSCR